MARELGPKGVHVAHVEIDVAVDTKWAREMFRNWFESRPSDGVMKPDELAEICWQIHVQLTFETDVRPYFAP